MQMKDVAAEKALRASEFLKKEIGAEGAEIALVLGSGWGDAIELQGAKTVPFTQIPGFAELGDLHGHARRAECGELSGKKVVVLRGRIHLNEAPCDQKLAEMVRLQIEMLAKLGVEKIVLTAAVGALNKGATGVPYRVGDICVIDGFATLFAPDMPLYAGEFCSPEDALDPDMSEIALKAASETKPLLTAHHGGYAMVRGPFFEGRKYDKPTLAATGARVVGMSTFPETCIASLYGLKVLAISFVTNDDLAAHSHVANVARAKESGSALGDYLTRIVSRI
jgi:purine-nucleoside phosphorylase